MIYEIRFIVHHNDGAHFCLDYSAGFGGRYGVQADRMDKVSSRAVNMFTHNQSAILFIYYYLFFKLILMVVTLHSYHS